MESATFPVGQVMVTAGVHDKMGNKNFATFVHNSLRRHISCDFGDVCPEDWKANQLALISESRIFSAYDNREGKIWIITEADRTATTVLFPEEY